MHQNSSASDLLTAHPERSEKKQWTTKELEGTLLETLRSDDATFIPFLDGLDEIQELDRQSIVLLVKKLSQLSNVRICTSSRPENTFSIAFESYPTLKVQDLNSLGVEAYAKQMLDPWKEYLSSLGVEAYAKQMLDWKQYLEDIIHADDIADKITTITKTIAYKAERVFLWARITTLEVVKWYESGDGYKTILFQIHGLEPDLNGPFEQIWSLRNANLAVHRDYRFDL